MHQFVAQTGSVYVTLDQGEKRAVTLEPGIYQKGSRDKRIFPVVFSRLTGEAFICVKRRGDRLFPREFRDGDDESDDKTSGYLIIGDDAWDEADINSLPDSWFRVLASGERRLEKKWKERLPTRIHFNVEGECSESPREGLGHRGWFMRRPLLLDPTAGTVFDSQTREVNKLARLASEGRSTSTTVTVFSALEHLHNSRLPLMHQKVLSFTDNRQDAALQAGHFNDFIQVVRLRAGLCRALKQAEENRLDFSKLPEAVFRAMGLSVMEYANTEVQPSTGSEIHRYERALQDYLFYRVLGDLQSNWRNVLPNLEGCALLDVQYQDLTEVAADEKAWHGVPHVKNLDKDARTKLFAAVLDYFRYEYALYSENYLQPPRLKENERRFRETLKSPWTLEAHEELPLATVMRLDPLAPRSRLPNRSLGTGSAFGKFIQHFLKSNGVLTDQLKGGDYGQFIESLMTALTAAGYLYRSTAKNRNNEEISVYQLRIEKIVWAKGDRATVRPNPIKHRSYKQRNLQIKPNAFFSEVYRRDFSERKPLRSEDHTGQLNTETRIEREERFRAEWYKDDANSIPDEEKIRARSLSTLFCSPTMELGIDIGGLSAVHMRNAPPNPSHYIQRSGRAGRSGQGAVIFTYCSSHSPHDRHYFLNQKDLVAGIVEAPHIDQVNEELLVSHLYALAIGDVGFPIQEEQLTSLVSLLEMEKHELPLADSVRTGLDLPSQKRDEIRKVFERATESFIDKLGKQRWYTDEWVDRNLANMVAKLDEALDRWRNLYRAAKAQISLAQQQLGSGLLVSTGPEYRKHERMLRQATRQLDLLRNMGVRGETEFYPYRYLASEGFFPGYNFTRLPLRVFLPMDRSHGEFVSRARAIALREFGPMNILYHAGKKFRMSSLMVPDSDIALKEAKVCTKSGYYLAGREKDSELCPFSGADLSTSENVEYLNNLIEMVETRGDEIERITCQEEERTFHGYDIATYFASDRESIGDLPCATVRLGDADLLRIRFLQAARLVHVNRRWVLQKEEGFLLGMSSGKWGSIKDANNQESEEPYKRVRPYTEETSDALYIEPIEALGLVPDGIITLQYALKRAIEEVFRAEPREIGVRSMGKSESPNIMIYEASEGSLGIMSQFIDDPSVFPRLVERAWEICRYEDEAYKAPASYDDLLSYFNQRDHERIDRALIKEALKKLGQARIHLLDRASQISQEKQYERLLKTMDPNSSTERVFIDHLYENDLRLPDEAQRRVDGIYCTPDFFYHPNVWVFCDGTPHDDPEVQRRDQAQRQLLQNRGDDVWTWHYKEDLAAKIASRPDIFRSVR